MIAAETFATVEVPGAWAPRADESARIGEAYGAYAPELAAYVARRFGGRVAPEDVVHEAFVRLVRDTAAGRSPGFVRAWLYRVVHNLAVDDLRRPIRLEPSGDDEPGLTATASSAEADYEARSLSPELRGALGSLSRAGRTTVLMAADGYTGREIAGAVGRSELATRALLCRTRRALRDALAASAGRMAAGPSPQLAA